MKIFTLVRSINFLLDILNDIIIYNLYLTEIKIRDYIIMYLYYFLFICYHSVKNVYFDVLSTFLTYIIYCKNISNNYNLFIYIKPTNQFHSLPI